ncbi:uncharacterized protein LOC105693050 isoform X2 [Athalia rosae]|uniref:uncharacterized protein LOC105693050 isoform X2 n=1 Tax=Athalia rosae TaxID=37344 RepID=UPI0020343377|nr:uncharacterized protein LOC105693050 isoform X2 [Athalia rosae]
MKNTSLFQSNGLCAKKMDQLELNIDQIIDSNIMLKTSERTDKESVMESSLKKRPLNLQDLVSDINLRCDDTEANFTLGDISESEEIWVLDVPKTINPKNFRGQTIKLGEKNNFEIGNDMYETCSLRSHDAQYLSLVFNTGTQKRPYKTGFLQIRQKLKRVLNVDLASQKNAGVPFPRNLKVRHPLFGHDYSGKLLPAPKKNRA